MWGLTEVLDTALKFLAPIAQSAGSAFIQSAMAPPQPTYTPGAPVAGNIASMAGLGAAGQGSTAKPTSMNFQGGFTGQAPSEPAQGPRPQSAGFSTIDPRRNRPSELLAGLGGSNSGFGSV